MTDANDSGTAPSLLAAKVLFATECALGLWAATSLFVFARNHAAIFAFPVEPAMTAAFLGANFAGGCAMKLTAMGERRWAAARQAVPGAVVYEGVVGVITAQHLDQFNLGHPPALIWIAAYLVLPFAGVWVLWRYRRPTIAVAAGPPIPKWVRGCIAGAAVAALASGVLLLAAPATAVAAWPWRLLPEGGPYAGTDGMTGYIAAWLLGIGITLTHATWENDARRSRCVFVGGMTLCLCNLASLARFSSEVHWASPAAWGLVAVLVTLMGAAGAGLRAGRRLRPAAPA